MRNYTNTEKTATFRNLYNGKEITCEFPCTMERQNYTQDVATSCGGHDFEIVEIDGFYGFADSVYITVWELNDIAKRIEALEDEDADKLEAMAEYCDTLDDIERVWKNSHFYADTTLADYAELLAEECGYLEAVPDFIRGYIDWEDMAEDMKIDDGYSEINGGVLFVAQ